MKMAGEEGTLTKENFIKILRSSDLFLKAFDKNKDGIVTEVMKYSFFCEANISKLTPVVVVLMNGKHLQNISFHKIDNSRVSTFNELLFKSIDIKLKHKAQTCNASIINHTFSNIVKP